jgi:hypothetical protein
VGQYKTWYDDALWLRDNTDPSAVVAAFNAGIIGFYSERTVINLDGKVNSLAYYRTVVRARKERPAERERILLEYLKENHVEYVADRFDVDRKGFPWARGVTLRALGMTATLVYEGPVYPGGRAGRCGRVFRITYEDHAGGPTP